MRISDWSSDVCSSRTFLLRCVAAWAKPIAEKRLARAAGSGPVNSTNSNPSRPRGLSHSVTGLVLCKKSVRSWLCVAAKGASSINAGPPPMFRYRVASLGAENGRAHVCTPFTIDQDGQDGRRHAPAPLTEPDRKHGRGG